MKGSVRCVAKLTVQTSESVCVYESVCVSVTFVFLLTGFLDPEKKLFSNRILSRDECIDPFSKTGNLRFLSFHIQYILYESDGTINSSHTPKLTVGRATVKINNGNILKVL